jgi:predicted TIM-barrel fold metal-dependent hydrolase
LQARRGAISIAAAGSASFDAPARMLRMLVDIHAHFAKSTPGSTPAARLATYAGTCRIDCVLIFNRDGAATGDDAANLDEAAANAVTLEACQTHKRLRPLYWVRPGCVDSQPATLAGALTLEAFAGAVFSPAEVGFDLADGVIDPYLSALAKVDRAALMRYTAAPSAHPERVYEAARRNPRTAIVLANAETRSNARSAALDVVAKSLERGDANLYFDTSHADADEIRTAVRTLGADRVLLGTNALSYGDAHVPRQFSVLAGLEQKLSPTEYRQVAGENAVRLFRLGGGQASPATG